MWRRASAKLLALRSVARPNRIVTSSLSPATLRPSATIVARHYSGNFLASSIRSEFNYCLRVLRIGCVCNCFEICGFDLCRLLILGVSKRVEDVMPIATGHEREELEAELEVSFL